VHLAVADGALARPLCVGRGNGRRFLWLQERDLFIDNLLGDLVKRMLHNTHTHHADFRRVNFLVARARPTSGEQTGDASSACESETSLLTTYWSEST